MDAIGNMLPIAMAIALGPIPIVAAVLVVGSPHGRLAGPIFGLGWMLGLLALSVIAAFLIGQIGPASPAGHLILDIMRILVGLLLLWAAVNKWRGRPRDGEEAPIPKWLGAFSQVTAARAFRIGATLAVANPKHIGLVLAAVSALLYEPKPAIEVIIGLVALVFLSSFTVVAVVLGHAIGGHYASVRLESVKQFMLRNNNVIVMVVLTILGMSVLGSGLSGLGAQLAPA